MSIQCYLKNDHHDLRVIGGIGEFAAHLPALPVPESIANQFDTEEMRAQGWVVTRLQHDHGAAVAAHQAEREESQAPSWTPFRAGETAAEISHDKD